MFGIKDHGSMVGRQIFANFLHLLKARKHTLRQQFARTTVQSLLTNYSDIPFDSQTAPLSFPSCR